MISPGLSSKVQELKALMPDIQEPEKINVSAQAEVTLLLSFYSIQTLSGLEDTHPCW